jgi:hypothetical protein
VQAAVDGLPEHPFKARGRDEATLAGGPETDLLQVIFVRIARWLATTGERPCLVTVRHDRLLALLPCLLDEDTAHMLKGPRITDFAYVWRLALGEGPVFLGAIDGDEPRFHVRLFVQNANAQLTFWFHVHEEIAEGDLRPRIVPVRDRRVALARVLRQADEEPDFREWWQAILRAALAGSVRARSVILLARATKIAAVVALVVLLSAPPIILTAPPEARAAVSNGWKELKRGLKKAYLRWCPGCEEPDRKTTWDFENPEMYYSPPGVSLRAKKHTFTVEARPAPALPLVQSEEIHVEAISDPSNTLNVRIAVTPSKELRRDDTKYYINFGDDPALKGSTNKMIAVGPAALMEHVFPRPGTYTIHISVAVKPQGAHREPFPSLPPAESDLYTTVDGIEIVLRVGGSASAR